MMCKHKLTLPTILLASLALSTTACDEFGGNISGEVFGEYFQYQSGAADHDGRGNYVITLSDAPNFTCNSTPSGNYLSIVIADVDGPGTYSASRTVSFNQIENNVNYSDSAFNGTVTIDTIDTDFSYTISGSISASGDDSDVSGHFTVDICD